MSVLVRRREIAYVFGVDAETPNKWARRGLLPPADGQVGGEEAWKMATLRRWGVETGRWGPDGPRPARPGPKPRPVETSGRAAARVYTGAAWLDDHHPDWYETPGAGSTDWMAAIGESHTADWAAAHGFAAVAGEAAALTRVWRTEVTTRRLL